MDSRAGLKRSRPVGCRQVGAGCSCLWRLGAPISWPGGGGYLAGDQDEDDNDWRTLSV